MVTVERTPHRLDPDVTRVVARPFLPGESAFGEDPSRVDEILERVLGIPDGDVELILEGLRLRFDRRHPDVEGTWEANARSAMAMADRTPRVDGKRQLLVGAYFTQEYAVEAAAVCNPSVVPYPADGAGTPDRLRFVMSLRAIGEGHISSIEFREGTFGSDGSVNLVPPGQHVRTGVRTPALYDKRAFEGKLLELGAADELTDLVLAGLPQWFQLEELEERKVALAGHEAFSSAVALEAMRIMHWIASSNYRLTFDDGELDERVLLPAGPADSRGMEDARFVRFVDEDGSVVYHATYTAFDGFRILPQLITTSDFSAFRISTMHGTCAQNKGMALFPRRIDGRFASLSRHDQRSLHLMFSDDVRSWNSAELLYDPTEPWEAVQVGNCGSPIETGAGWLVLTHGVGPVRTYSIGAMLLDLEDPGKVLGRLVQPLLAPAEDEADGYVPNVVYSCGGMIHGGRLLLPYGISDRSVGFAVVDVEELLDTMA